MPTAIDRRSFIASLAAFGISACTRRPTPPFPTLEAAGAPGDLGLAQGTAFASQIRENLDFYLDWLSLDGAFHRDDGRPGRFGVPIHCLLRVVMNSASLGGAIAAVDTAPRSASANFLLAQHDAAEPRAVDLEISPESVAALTADGGDLFHTNHFLDPGLAAGDTGGRGPSTSKRLARARALAEELAPTVVDPVLRAEKVLESRADLPYPISRDHNPDPSSSTLAGIVMDLTRDRFILTGGAPHLHPWVDLPGI